MLIQHTHVHWVLLLQAEGASAHLDTVSVQHAELTDSTRSLTQAAAQHTTSVSANTATKGPHHIAREYARTNPQMAAVVLLETGTSVNLVIVSVDSAGLLGCTPYQI